MWIPTPIFSVNLQIQRLFNPLPASDILQHALLVIFLSKLGQLDEKLIDLLDGQEAFGCWRTRFALLKEEANCLRNVSLSPRRKQGCWSELCPASGKAIAGDSTQF